jgi:mannosyltransferase OCH1-like enzyme
MNLHYIWIDFKNESNPSPKVPENLKKKINNCSRVNSNLTTKIWNGPECRQLIVDHYPEYLKLYDSLPYTIIRCDMIRYFILYHYGGFYLDCDRACQLPLEELVKNNPDVLLGKNPNFMYNGINNDFMYAKKGSDFMKTCMQNIKLIERFIYNFTVMETAGPMFLTKQYKSYKGPDKITVLNKEVNGCNICNCDMGISESYTYSDFSKTSWSNYLDKIARLFYCNWIIIVSVLLISYFIYKYTMCRKGCGPCKLPTRYIKNE